MGKTGGVGGGRGMVWYGITAWTQSACLHAGGIDEFPHLPPGPGQHLTLEGVNADIILEHFLCFIIVISHHKTIAGDKECFTLIDEELLFCIVFSNIAQQPCKQIYFNKFDTGGFVSIVFTTKIITRLSYF